MAKTKTPIYKITFTKNAQKQYNKLPNTVKPKVARAIANLSINPLKGKKLGGELNGFRSLRAWPYRIIYRINIIDRRIDVSDILHRQGAYK